MKAFEDHTQWSAVKDVCRQLKDSGYQALLAGGCVRDLLMNRTPNDFDIATSATPDQVEALFPNSIAVGKAFGVIIVPFQGFQLEIATFREDLEYKDGRRPEGVKFSTAEADAKRRDFTVNALFYDLSSQKVIDYVGGEKDIAKKIIRTVGEPHLRFQEDKLRLLRAVRFAAQLDFEITPETLATIVEMADEVKIVSRERVRDELIKLLKSENCVRGFELILATGLAQTLFPELTPMIHQEETAWLKRLEIYASLRTRHENDEVDATDLGLTLFFSPAREALSIAALKEMLKNLRLDNKRIQSIAFVYEHLNEFLKPESVRAGELATLLSNPSAPLATAFGELTYGSGKWRQALDEAEARLLEPGRQLPKPFLTGADLKSAGIPAGPKMGSLLKESHYLQIEGKLISREQALEWVKNQSS